MYSYYKEVEKMVKSICEQDKTIKEKSRAFYIRHALKFFKEYMSLPENENKPINAITYYDVNCYLDTLPYSDNHKANVYNSLKKIFKYTYKQGITGDIMNGVAKPEIKKKSAKIIPESDYQLLKNFVLDEQYDLRERLVLWLFMFTGLQRQYIAKMKISQFIFENRVYKLSIIKNPENEMRKKYYKLPLKVELQLIISQYLRLFENSEEKIVSVDENSLSSYISNITKKITSKSYSPKVFARTFVVKALEEGNRIWEVSNLVLESVGHIAKLIDEDPEKLFLQQSIILSKL